MTQSSPIDLEKFVPLPMRSDSVRLAQQLTQQHPQNQQTERIYHNLIAVLAVNQYLKMLGFSTDLSQCDCWDPFLRMTMDVADLDVVGYGRIECCPVSSAIMATPSPVCVVPSDVQEERIGYIVVQIEGDLATAEPRVQLVGFTDTVTEEQLPLGDLTALSELPHYLQSLTQPLAHLLAQQKPVISHLTEWLNQTVEADWTSVKALIGLPIPFSYSVRDLTTDRDCPQCMYGKTLILETQQDTHTIALIVEVIQTPEVEFAVELKICPIVDRMSELAFLPAGLEMMILDQMGGSVMQAQTRTENRMIELGFHAEQGDRFQLKVQLDDTVVTESFLV